MDETDLERRTQVIYTHFGTTKPMADVFWNLMSYDDRETLFKAFLDVELIYEFLCTDQAIAQAWSEGADYGRQFVVANRVLTLARLHPPLRALVNMSYHEANISVTRFTKCAEIIFGPRSQIAGTNIEFDDDID